ncbi:hypothetical protein Halru_1601 [Halovivax ruber XH-70]|uniref:DUF7343 domain-containing protein n=1 Tax=Halovivax ruber (strain DSM 18193 / JCM 13892 / XH-70) TaxID=797302 RepID=L0IBL2_HALRX|nr:MarR family transcriptional regulator [Halovivax ruber]AGB16208.1 hypothetical protein Halru_1601 [Halovivax ruber XH-70]
MLAGTAPPRTWAFTAGPDRLLTPTEVTWVRANAPIVDELAVGPLTGDRVVVLIGLALGVVGLALLGSVVRTRLTASGSDQQSPPEPEPPLTDHEYVLKLLAENGGRIKQAEIVESVDWSKAKVSRVVADLEAEREITKLRLGRENLICRPGSEPAASRSKDE